MQLWEQRLVSLSRLSALQRDSARLLGERGQLTASIAHVAPQDIDQVKLGASAVLRFTNLNQRTTPEIEGEVSRIGTDVSRDDKTAPTYFLVRIAIPPSALNKLATAHLLPGMLVEVFIRTSERTVLSYLMKPLADQVHRAFREK
ncbi:MULTISPECIES: hypothetical protein [unclassified Bradyrhizobium]